MTFYRIPVLKHIQPYCDLKKGWKLQSLHAVDTLKEIANTYGLQLIHQKDLTPFLRKNRLRDWANHLQISAIRRLLPQSLYGHALDGGDARWLAIRKGLISYRFLHFQKSN